MKGKKIVSLILICLMIVSSLSACGGKETEQTSTADATSSAATSSTTSTSSTEAGALVPSTNASETRVENDTPVVIYCANLFNTLDPYQTNGTGDNYIFTNIYECLATMDNEGNINPQLAESWDVSDDALTYTFHLCKDAYFHNGDNVKASDVAFTIDYAKQYVKRQTYWGMIDSCTAVDDYTVEIKLNAVSPLFLSYLYYLPVLSEKVVTENGGDISKTDAGSGPYTVTDYDSAQHCIMAAVEDYHFGAPAIKQAEFRYISDESSAQISFEAGEIQVMNVSTNQADNVIASGAYNTECVNTQHTTLILINCAKAPLDNPLVRKALSYAIDKDAVIDIAYNGYANVARLMSGSDCFGVDFSDAEDITYNPEKAKELLAEAGYPDGINFSDYGIELNTLTSGYYEKVAQVVQNNWSDIGVSVEIVGNSNASSDICAGNYGFFAYGYAYKSDLTYEQAHYTSANIGGSNGSQYSDAYVDQAFADADAELDSAKRAEIYKELTTYLVDACPNIPLFHKQNIVAWDKKLHANFYSDVNHEYVIYDWYWTE